VVVDEAGCHKAAAEIDHARARRAMLLDVGGASDGQQALAANGECLCVGVQRVARPDAAIPHDNVGILSRGERWNHGQQYGREPMLEARESH
jgi:hypothetical protein